MTTPTEQLAQRIACMEGPGEYGPAMTHGKIIALLEWEKAQLLRAYVARTRQVEHYRDYRLGLPGMGKQDDEDVLTAMDKEDE